MNAMLYSISMCVCVCVRVHVCTQLCLTLCDPPWTVACQASLSMEFSRKEYWNWLSLYSPKDLPNLRIEPVSLASSALAGRFFTTSATWEGPQLAY